MPLILGAVGGGLLGLVGDLWGGKQANDANWDINQANIRAAQDRQNSSQSFNSGQAYLARQFSAQQVKQQEAFQQNQQTQAMNYDTNMSNTAMQRRMDDLRRSGVNPLLAVSQGGASTPTISGMSGSSAQGVAAQAGIGGQGSGIPMQNIGKAFEGLGGTIGNAVNVAQTQANIDLLKAQTDKVNKETGVKMDADVAYLKSMTNLSDQNAEVAKKNLDLIVQQVYETKASGMLKDTQGAGQNIQNQLAGQNLEVLKATKDALISAAHSDAEAQRLGLDQLRNMNDVAKGKLGEIITYLNAILSVGHSARGLK